MTREWDATTYDRVANPHVGWGAAVLGRLDAAPTAPVVVLDAGCGTGRVTELLLERWPAARVVAVDGSRQMLSAAERRLAFARDRVDFVAADLTEPLALPAGTAAVDAVVSTATFHWIADHDRLFANLAAVLAPAGQLVAQCGGAGNLASVEAALSAIDPGLAGKKHYATAEATKERLERAGFVDVETWLEDAPVAFPGAAALEEYLAAVVLGGHLERLAAGEHAGFVRSVAERLPAPVLDYVRLNVVARRGSEDDASS